MHIDLLFANFAFPNAVFLFIGCPEKVQSKPSEKAKAKAKAKTTLSDMSCHELFLIICCIAEMCCKAGRGRKRKAI